MKKSDITYIVGSVFAAATAFFYCCTMWFHIKLPRYYPTEHTWKWVNEKGVPSQGWYGQQAFAYLTAGAVALVVYLVLKQGAPNRVNLEPGPTKLLGATTTIVVVICMGYMLYYEFARWGVFSSLASGCTCQP